MVTLSIITALIALATALLNFKSALSKTTKHQVMSETIIAIIAIVAICAIVITAICFIIKKV